MRRRWVRVILVLLVLGGAWRLVRPRLRPAPPPPGEAALAHARSVRILRDEWGVPHVFGHSDADAAFGLAYANAEDDWPMIQGVLAAARGRLSLLFLSKQALANDYYVALIRVAEETDRQYPLLGSDTRAVLEAYAAGLSYYAYRHPGEADGRLLPIRGRDIAAGFVHKLPVLMGFAGTLAGIVDDPPAAVGDPGPRVLPGGGSNAHAVHRARSTDDVTRLNVNSHQPWEGPVAWYEAQVHSDEGWNMTGGTFPGAPFILHGHNDHLGWAHTVNTPDLVDVYKLTMRGEQWYRMNKATNLAEWKAAMSLRRIPQFNTVYADRDNIHYVYNALIPRRKEGADYQRILPGDRSDLVWSDYLPYAELPQIDNPRSGFVQNCNSTPWGTTTGEDSLRPPAWAATAGVETAMTNRGLRSIELLGGAAPLDRAAFLAMKWDRAYSAQSDLRRRLIDPLVSGFTPASDVERRAVELLRGWDGRTSESSPAAALAVAAWRKMAEDGQVDRARKTDDPAVALRRALDLLHGRLDVPLGDLLRLRRGDVDLPLGGGPDVLNAAYSREKDGKLVGYQGDSYVLEVEFTDHGPVSQSVS